MKSLQSYDTGTLDPFIPSEINPWNSHKVIHVYRRIAFSAYESQINTALLQTPGDFIDALVDAAIAQPITLAPPVADNWKLQAFDNMLTSGLRERLVLFWSNHFVTEYPVYVCDSYIGNYYNTLQFYAIGNFKAFVSEIGLIPAMLVYLNGLENTAIAPNENYARELYELFTLGENNGYDQTDIEETSRALTGYNNQLGACDAILYNPATFDNTEKTIFGVTANFNYQGVIDNLFDQRPDEIAQFICTKLYAYFVSPTIDETIVSGMVATFITNNWEIAPVLRELFKSEHFFNENTVGVIIKSPYDLILGLMNELNYSFPFGDNGKNGAEASTSLLGQEIFNPPDVAGWQGNLDWTTTSLLPSRYSTCQLIINWIVFTYGDEEHLRTLAMQIAGDADNHGNNPAVITQRIADRFLPKGLHEDTAYVTATNVFKGEVPQNYFDDGTWTLAGYNAVPYQVLDLMNHIFGLPEFNLK